MIADYLNLAFRNIKKRRLRAFLTLTGILISIATIFILISLSLGLEAAVVESFEELGTDKFFIQPRGQFGPPGTSTAAVLTEDDEDFVRKISGVKDTASFVIANSKVEYKGTLKFTTVIGIEPDKMEIAFGTYDAESGRLLRDSDDREVLLGYNYRYKDFLGQPVTVGSRIKINDLKFKVVGIVEAIGNPQDDRQIYMPEDELRKVFDIPDRVDAIIVQVSDKDAIEEVAEKTEKRLMKFRDVDEDTIDFTILTPEELLDSIGNILDIISAFLLGIAGISLIVGGINIANTMFTSVLERTNEIGVMKAIGSENKDILLIFIIEAGLLGIVGGILGIILAIGIGKGIEYVAINIIGTNLLKVVTPIPLIIGTLMFSFLTGVLSGLLPAWKATKIKPVEALRYE